MQGWKKKAINTRLDKIMIALTASSEYYGIFLMFLSILVMIYFPNTNQVNEKESENDQANHEKLLKQETYLKHEIDSNLSFDTIDFNQ